MGAIFHNYKQLLQITKEDNVIYERTLEYELTSLLETKYEGKILFYRYSKKWHGFIYSLHKEDKLILLKMVLEVCSYGECTINRINIQDSKSSIDFLFFLLSMLLQQKRIDMLNADETKKAKDVTQDKRCDTFRFYVQLKVEVMQNLQVLLKGKIGTQDTSIL